MIQHTNTRYALLALMLCLTSLAWAEVKLEIVNLQHRMANEIIPAIQPFVYKGGVISAKDNKIFIRTSDENLVELKRLIEKLDVPLRRLMIHVKQPQSSSREGTSDELNSQGNVRVYRSGGRDQAVADQQIQVLEGRAAMIKTGQLIPVVKQRTTNGSSGQQTETRIEHQDVSSGFQVIPQLSGNTVTLEILPFAAAPASTGGGIIQQQQAHTTVTGKLNEWIELGGAGTQQNNQGRGTVYSTQSRDEMSRRVLIKVTEVP